MAEALLDRGPAEEGDFLDLARASDMVRRREVSALELTDRMLHRIERLNPVLNAFVAILGDDARAQARVLDIELGKGQWRGPLTGLAFAVKDVMHVAGARTSAGSRSMGGFVATHDAHCVQRLRAAGAVVVGKLHTHELAAGATSANALHGAAHNPWNTAHVPGGSSGGSAIAAAARLAHGALGTDTGGSVRIPAAFCGVVGFKGTYGSVGRSGVLSRSWTMDTVGILARRVRDAALVFDAIAGHDPDDPYSDPRPHRATATEWTGDVGRVRAGVLEGRHFADGVDGEIGSAFEAAVGTLAAIGVRTEPVRFDLAAASHAAAMLITLAEADSGQDEGLRARPGAFDDDVRGQLQLAEFISARQYLRALRIRPRVQSELNDLFRRVDVLLTPTTTDLPPRADQVNGGRVVRFARNTRPFSLVGLPAISVPAGFSKAGLPIGLQIVGRPFDERTVLQVAAAYEQATRWYECRPADATSAVDDERVDPLNRQGACK
jgi:aspartyl-tRNA(Asn)/glutamyl-tRNA(Gln) amidotransferase subunit A